MGCGDAVRITNVHALMRGQSLAERAWINWMLLRRQLLLVGY